MKNIVGLFDRYEDAERATAELNRHGFDQSAISVIARQDAAQRHLAAVLEDIEDPVTEKNVGAGIAAGAPLGSLASC